MAFELPKLPYALDALAPIISEETLNYHYGKHHAAYVANLNKLIEQDPSLEGLSLEDLIKTGNGPLFNNAAQVWNHTFYWDCLSPNAQGAPKGVLKEAIIEQFGSVDNFKEQFSKAAIATFGSGWAWLIKDGNNALEIISTSNAGTPMTTGRKALLTCDVWEHAYYIDYRNARPKYVEKFWEIVNWEFVADNFAD